MDISTDDLTDLQYAKSLLENPGLAVKIVNYIGMPIEKGFAMLPEGWSEMVSSATRKALSVAIDSAILTLNKSAITDSTNTFHKLLAAGSGAAGGFLGLPALPVELPFSTTIILRSIADIARSEGQRLSEPGVKIACVEVFALGGPSSGDDGLDTGYFAIRSALARSVREAASYVAKRGMAGKSAPVIVKLLSQISSRFGVQVSEKIAAQAIPVIGAAGGAIINTLFIDHFQNMARGHFIILRLEKKYGLSVIRQSYEQVG
jgi:hypothetical protein